MAAVDELKKEGHEIAGFFYNPNIHPYSEYLRRKEALERYADETGLGVVYGGYDIEDYFQHIVYNEALNKRCPVCWWLRMAKTAQFAGKNNLDAFTTTLLGSPYQDHDTVKRLGGEVAKNSGIKFYYKDFRPNFKSAHEMAHQKGTYCQNYCGCVFSEKERIEKKNRGK